MTDSRFAHLAANGVRQVMENSGSARSTNFEAVLYPNQPQNEKTFSAIMVSAMVILIVAGVGFILAGAWPVTGFLGLDLLLLALAFRWSRRESERREHIRLDATGLHIRSVDPDGRERNWRFERHWVRVHMDEPPRPGSALTLQEGGRSLTLGQFLTPNERLELAKAIRVALHNSGHQTA